MFSLLTFAMLAPAVAAQPARPAKLQPVVGKRRRLPAYRQGEKSTYRETNDGMDAGEHGGVKS